MQETLTSFDMVEHFWLKLLQRIRLVLIIYE